MKDWLVRLARRACILAFMATLGSFQLYADKQSDGLAAEAEKFKVPAGGQTSEKYQMKLNSAGFAEPDTYTPRTLEGYVSGENSFFDLLIDVHPMFKYEKAGRLIGKYTMSDRMEEFVEINKGPIYAKKTDQAHAAVTYRLGMESILDYPNKFVGPKKCGECHPAQYAQWDRSRHSKVVRFPDQLAEVDGDPKKKLYGTEASILPWGIYPDDVYAIIGTPRTKYGFLDKWLVRGTYHIEDGNLSDLTGYMVAGGNQFSRNWAEHITPEVARKIAEFAPGFPTKMEDFGPNGSKVWGVNSYGSKNRETMMFQPASSYCEVCHSFKFDFKSKDEFFAAIGDQEALRKHTISRGISCEECHGAGAHLYGARGAGMPSNCERCHQRFAYLEDDEGATPRKPFNAYFKSSCPSCGTEGAQLYNSLHYDKGIRCNTCHDPHEVTANDWKDEYTLTGLKKTCQDCHETQTEFFKATGGIHAKDNCTGCHMPNMMSCENFAAIQHPDKAGFDNVRASHIWNIKVDKTAKTLNPPEGKERDAMKVKGWRIARDDKGKFFLDLMWSCGRTSYSDPNLVGPGAAGCHSPIQSTLPNDLKFTNQEMIYDKVMEWQTPVKTGYEDIKKGLREIDKAIANNATLDASKKSEVMLLAKQANDIRDRLERDGSWGVHGPQYSKKIVNEALVYIEQAHSILGIKK